MTGTADNVLSWRLSNTLDGGFCLEALEEALSHGKPEIFNTDLGSQFTSWEYTGRLEEAGIAVSRDGRGRALDNIFIERLWRSVKYEDIYIKDYAFVPELVVGLTAYFRFDDEDRPHQSLNYQTPGEVYRAGVGAAGRGRTITNTGFIRNSCPPAENTSILHYPTNSYLVSWIARIFSLKNSWSRNPYACRFIVLILLFVPSIGPL